MPFELGIAWLMMTMTAQREPGRRHRFVVLEKEPYRLQKTLSDLSGCDPHIHHGTAAGVCNCLLDVIRSPADPPPDALIGIADACRRLMNQLKRKHHIEPYTPQYHRLLVSSATTAAKAAGLIQ